MGSKVDGWEGLEVASAAGGEESSWVGAGGVGGERGGGRGGEQLIKSLTCLCPVYFFLTAAVNCPANAQSADVCVKVKTVPVFQEMPQDKEGSIVTKPKPGKTKTFSS